MRSVLAYALGLGVLGLAGESLAGSDVSAAAPAASPANARHPEPLLELVELKDRTRYAGLIDSEDGDRLRLIRILSPRGQPTHLVVQPFDQRQIARVTRLDDGNRAVLQKQIEEFRRRAVVEAVRMDSISLERHADEGNQYRRYRNRWFVLDSTADEQNTRRLAVRAEQIFTSYRQILPPRREAVQPLRLIVLGSMDEYHALLPKLGLKAKIDNPACYAEDRNTVVVGSDLTRLAKVTGQVGLQNAELRRDLRDLEERFPDRIRALADNLRKSGASNGEVSRELAKESAKFKRQIEKKREELRKSDQQIEGLFKKNAGQTIVRLYHELFHAYLRNCVYPRRQFDVPPWLNEGLAVIFEGGLLEGDLLRVDAPNPAALRKLKADLAGPEPLGLEDVLAAGEEQFLFTSGAPSAAADRHYVHAWGLAYYLTFERRILGSSELEAYLRAGPAPPAPCQRFQRLIGMPLAQFEQEWRTYIRGLE